LNSITTGATIADVARRLGMQIGTVRVHLRSIFAKTGTNRQAELVALLGRLRP
jgi:DNA-binding CsgD family transcriptional regulator